MDLLHEKGWIADSRSAAKSVVLTEDGERLAEEFRRRHFESRGATAGSPADPGSRRAMIATVRRVSQQRNPTSVSRSDSPKAGAVLYAKNVERVVAFYSAVLGFRIQGGDERHVLLESPSFQLVVLRIPEQIASSITITVPPTRRENAAIKPVFVVSSIAAVRAGADACGGLLNPSDKEWSFQDSRCAMALTPKAT